MVTDHREHISWRVKGKWRGIDVAIKWMKYG